MPSSWNKASNHKTETHGVFNMLSTTFAYCMLLYKGQKPLGLSLLISSEEI